MKLVKKTPTYQSQCFAECKSVIHCQEKYISHVLAIFIILFCLSCGFIFSLCLFSNLPISSYYDVIFTLLHCM